MGLHDQIGLPIAVFGHEISRIRSAVCHLVISLRRRALRSSCSSSLLLIIIFFFYCSDRRNFLRLRVMEGSRTSSSERRNRLYALVVLSVATMLIIYSIVGYARSHRYSYFYVPDELALERQEREKLAQAELYLNELYASNWTSSQSYGSVEAPEVCVAILSGKARHRYIVRCSVSIIRDFIESDTLLRSRFAIHLFTPPPSEIIGDEDYRKLSQMLPSHPAPEKAIHEDAKGVFIARENDNYIQALNTCLALRSRHSLLVEDDAVAGKGMLRHLYGAIRKLEQRRAVDWIWIKLFFTDYYLGWAWPDDAVTLTALPLSSFIVSFTALRRTMHRVSLGLCVALALHVSALVLFCLLAVGKQHIIRSFPRGLYVSDVSSATVAHLYNNVQVPELIRYLQSTEKEPIDWMLDDYRRLRGLKQYHLVPHLFQHFGRFSSAPFKNQGSWKWLKQSPDFIGEAP